MSTRSRPPRSPDDPWEDEDPTVIDGAPFVEGLNEVPREHPDLRKHDPPPGEFDTPVDVSACHECGRIVVLDDFTDVALHAYPDHCMRARNGTWWWCSKLRKSVTYVPE